VLCLINSLKDLNLPRIFTIGLTALTSFHGNWVAGAPAAPESSLSVRDTQLQSEVLKANQLLNFRKFGTAYPGTPSVEVLSISSRKPLTDWSRRTPLSAGLTDPILERARELKAFDDYKILSDLRAKNPLPTALLPLKEKALKCLQKALDPMDCQRAFFRNYIDNAYEHPIELFPVKDLSFPKFKMKSGNFKIDAVFQHTEDTWEKLLKQPMPARGGSLLPAPYPVLLPAGRFQEAYYWDSYFGIKGLLATGRLEIAQMQVENFLSSVRMYGFVPNGGRDYYLSRSQPPFLSSMVREVYSASSHQGPQENAHLRRWLKERAYPLVKLDYLLFWMDPSKRFDPKTGLNHHWDDINLPRPERHSADNEIALGKEYRDVRAAAESGLDFTEEFECEATHIAGPLLNSMLYKTEKDLSWMAHEIGNDADRDEFLIAAKNRKRAIDKFLWNAKKNRFEAYHLLSERQVNVLSAETFIPLFVGAASAKQAAGVRTTLRILEKAGGLMSTELTHSPEQWDGNNGWAPYQVMAIDGLRRYGFRADAHRIATKWVSAIAQIFSEKGCIYERIDVATSKEPSTDSYKYPTQEGFLWTNGSFNSVAIEVLKYSISN
jgi:alpha,alpha-trehalase